MKKFVACLMILSLSVFTVGCGKTDDKSGSAKSGSAKSESAKSESAKSESEKSMPEAKTEMKTEVKTGAPE